LINLKIEKYHDLKITELYEKIKFQNNSHSFPKLNLISTAKQRITRDKNK